MWGDMDIARTIIIGLVLLVTGCTTIGPQSVERDRFDYNSAISNSWKEQTLLNIVKIRYADMPLFVEVASVVSDNAEFQTLIRAKLMKGGGVGYIKPTPDLFPSVEDLHELTAMKRR